MFTVVEPTAPDLSPVEQLFQTHLRESLSVYEKTLQVLNIDPIHTLTSQGIPKAAHACFENGK